MTAGAAADLPPRQGRTGQGAGADGVLCGSCHHLHGLHHCNGVNSCVCKFLRKSHQRRHRSGSDYAIRIESVLCLMISAFAQRRTCGRPPDAMASLRLPRWTDPADAGMSAHDNLRATSKSKGKEGAARAVCSGACAGDAEGPCDGSVPCWSERRHRSIPIRLARAGGMQQHASPGRCGRGIQKSQGTHGLRWPTSAPYRLGPCHLRPRRDPR